MTKNEHFYSSPCPAPEMGLSTPAEPQTSEPLVYANLWHRFVAGCCDSANVCVIAYVTLFFLLIALNLSFQFFGGLEVFDVKEIFEFKKDQMPRLIFSPILLVVGCIYFSLKESSGAQATRGEKAMRLKVVGLSGERISFGRATGRYCGRHIFLLIWLLGYGQISLLVFFLGYLMQPFTKKKQTLHDLIAGTLVIKY